MKNLSSNQKIVYIAILAAVGFLMTYFGVPYPLVPYLKIELSEAVVLIGLLISPAAAFTIAIIKGVLDYLLKGGNPIGSYALILGSFTIILTYMLSYNTILKKLTENKRTALSLVIVGLVFVPVMCANNFFITDPLYFEMSFSEIVEMYGGLKGYLSYNLSTYLLFNVLKITVVCVTFYFVKLYMINRDTKSENIDLDQLDPNYSSTSEKENEPSARNS